MSSSDLPARHPLPTEEALREAQALGIVLPVETTVLTLLSQKGEWVVVRRDQHPLGVPLQTYKAELEGQGWSFALSWFQSEAPSARAALLYARSPVMATSAPREHPAAGEQALTE